MLIRQSRILLSSISALALMGAAATAYAGGNELITKDSFYGEPLPQDSFHPSLSNDGNTTVFASYATDLAPGADGTFSQIYIYDKAADQYKRVPFLEPDGSSISGNLHSPVVSGDGQIISFRYSSNPSITAMPERVYLYDRGTQDLTLVANITDDSGYPYPELEDELSLSNDGGLLFFSSGNSSLAPGDTNNTHDIYRFDRNSDQLDRISVWPDGFEMGTSYVPSASGDGCRVAFLGDYNLTLLYDCLLNEITPISISYSEGWPGSFHPTDIDISEDGNHIAVQVQGPGAYTIETGSKIFTYDVVNEVVQKIYEEQMPSPDYGYSPFVKSGVKISNNGDYVLFGALEINEQNFPLPDGQTTPIEVAEANVYRIETATTNKQLLTSRGTLYFPQLSITNFVHDMTPDGQTTVFESAVLVSGPEPVLARNIFIGSELPANTPPSANAGIDLQNSGYSVPLDGSGSLDDQTATANLKFEWDVLPLWENQDINSIDQPTAMMPSLNNLESSESLVRLIVTDSNGLFSAPDYMFVTPGNAPPFVDVLADGSVFLGDIVFLQGYAEDPDNDPMTYQWTLISQPAGSSVVLNASTLNTNFLPDVAGTYTAQLTVSDGTESVSAQTTTIVIDPIAYASDQVVAARSTIAGLSRGDFDGRKSQRTLLGYLDDALDALSSGDNAGAISWIDETIKRSDGCSLTGAPDGKGKGKDWITNCSAATQVYDLLIDAKSVL